MADERTSLYDLAKRQETHGDVSWDDVRQLMNRGMERRGEWAGAPLPVDELKLILEPRYPAPGLQGKRFSNPPVEETMGFELASQFDWSEGTIVPINKWYCRNKQADVHVYHTGNGRSKCVLIEEHTPQLKAHMLVTTACAAYQAWTIKAELQAMDKLKTLIKPHLFEVYQTIGMFMETSEQSGVTYLFRRARPTLAVKATEDGRPCKILAALCLHPIGYYDDSFAGVMVPTDDVIAHLLLVRGDERYFWAKANHHPLHSAAAGI